MCPQLTAKEWSKRGDGAYARKEYVAARDAYTEALKLNPQYVDAYLGRGTTQGSLGNHQAVIEDFTQVIKLNPHHADAYLGRGTAQFTLGSYSAAIEDLTHAIKLKPQSADAYYNAYLFRATAQKALGKNSAALEDLTQAIKLNPQAGDTYFLRGTTQFTLGNYSAAIEDLTQAIKLNPQAADAYGHRAMAQKGLGNYQAAIEDFTQVLKLNPQQAGAYGHRGVAQVALGNYQAAIEDYTHALKLTPKNAGGYVSRGLLHVALSQYQLALADFKQALQFNPNHATASLSQGWVALAQSQAPNVTNALTQGLALAQSANAKAWGQGIQALLYLAQGEFNQAASAIESARQLITSKEDIWPILSAIAAEIYLAQGKAKDALAAAQISTPTPWRWLLALAGMAQWQLGLKDAALISLQQAIKAPDFPYIEKGYAWQARLHLQLGKLQVAQKDIEKALAINSQDVFIYVVRAEIKEAQDDKTGATADYETYLKIYPNHPVIQKRYQILKAESDKFEKLTTNLAQLTLSFQIPYKELNFGAELGEGGFGIVYQGIYRENSVAIKTLRLSKPTEKTLQAFRKEIKIMANLRAPNIVQFYGVCDEPNHYCIVMEYMAKGSLYHLLHSTEVLDKDRTLHIAKDIIRGLAFLHAIPLVHCDLKSMNVLLDAYYNAKLCDFGLSDLKTETSTTTSSPHSVGGTIAWMAPELFKRNAVSTPQSDMYSYSMVLWELTTRKHPFADAKGKVELISQWVRDGERENIPSNAHPKLARLITWGWKEKPEERPSAKEALAVLDAPEEQPVSDYLGNFVSAQM